MTPTFEDPRDSYGPETDEDPWPARRYDVELLDDPQYLGTWTAELFPAPHAGRLDLWDTFRTDSYGKSILRYRLTLSVDDHAVTFDGEGFCPAPSLAIDSDESASALLGFFVYYAEETDQADGDAPDFTEAQWDALQANPDGLTMWAADLEGNEDEEWDR